MTGACRKARGLPRAGGWPSPAPPAVRKGYMRTLVGGCTGAARQEEKVASGPSVGALVGGGCRCERVRWAGWTPSRMTTRDACSENGLPARRVGKTVTARRPETPGRAS